MSGHEGVVRVLQRAAPRRRPGRVGNRSCVAFLAGILLLAVHAGCREDAPPSGEKDPGSATARPESIAKPAEAPVAPSAAAVEPRLNNAAAEAGIDFTYFNDEVPDRYFLPEVMGGGAAWIDYDLDGWWDLFWTNGCRLEAEGVEDREHQDQLFRNLGQGNFANVTAASGAGLDKYGQGVAVGDYDVDGFPDLYIANYGPNVLVRNNGDGTFTDVTAEAGVGDDKWGSSVAFADLDGDQDLDIYVTNFLNVTFATHQVCQYDNIPGYCGPGSYLGDQDPVYLNQGDGTFRESSEALGCKELKGAGKGLCVSIVDLNDDLVPEIYVGNDMMPNYLYVRKPPESLADSPGESANVTYEERGMAAGCAVSDAGENEASMGIAHADFNGDGRTDIFLCHFHLAKNTLYTNYGNLSFSDESRRSRIAATSYDNLCFGTVAFDYDRDGAADLFNTTGHVLGRKYTPNEMTPQLLHNDGRGVFQDVSASVGGEYFASKWFGRAVAGGDYDNDGDTDIAISHLTKAAALLRNDTQTGRHFLGLELRTPSRIPPVGGRVVVIAGKLKQVLPIAAGTSYHASHDPRLLFGLGNATEPAEVTIYWPSGRVDALRLEPDRYWCIFEGSPPFACRDS